MTKNQDTIVRLQEELRVAKSSLEILMSTISYLIWIKDSNDRYIQVNQSFADFCGKTTDNMIGKTDIDIWGEGLEGKPFIEGYKPNNIEVTVIELQETKHPKFGKQYFKIIMLPILKINGTASYVTVGIAINITDQIDRETIAKAAIIELQRQLSENTLVK